MDIDYIHYKACEEVVSIFQRAKTLGTTSIRDGFDIFAWGRCQNDVDVRVFVTWGRLNIQMLSYHYRDPHVKDKTVSRPSYL